MSEQPSWQERAPAPSASSGRLQVLTTEHWSLLASRSLNYSEAFSRVTMFLSVLTGAVIALALLAQVSNSHRMFLIFGIVVFSVVMFIGLATVGRLAALNRENIRWVMGLNRIRHAYLEMYPDVGQYFVAGIHDDQRGILLTMDVPYAVGAGSWLAMAGRGFQTLPGMLAVVVAAVGGVLAAMVVALVGGSTLTAGILGVLVFLATNLFVGLLARRRFLLFAQTLTPRFTSEGEVPRREETA